MAKIAREPSAAQRALGAQVTMETISRRTFSVRPEDALAIRPSGRLKNLGVPAWVWAALLVATIACAYLCWVTATAG